MYTKPKRPIGITLLALVFLWIGGLGTLIFPVLIINGALGLLVDAVRPSLHISHFLSLTIMIVGCLIWYGFYVLYLCIGIGLWRLRLWALKAIIFVQWVAIPIMAILAFSFASFGLVMVVGVVVWSAGFIGGFLWYLNRPAVRWPFEVVYAGEHRLPQPPPPPLSTTPRWKKVTIGCGIGVVVFATFISAIMSSVNRMMRQSGAYNMALQRAQASPCVIAALGSPIISKGMIEGNIEEGATDGKADMDIPVRGPKATGTLHIEAAREDGLWSFTDITLMYGEGQIHLAPIASPCGSLP